MAATSRERATSSASNSAPRIVGDAERAQVGFVERRVEPVGAETRLGIQLPHARDDRPGQPRRGVHRQIERDEVSRPDRIRVERLTRQIERGDVAAGIAQPRRRRREAERLPSHFIRGQQQHARHRSPTGSDWPLSRNSAAVSRGHPLRLGRDRPSPASGRDRAGRCLRGG